MTKDLLDAIRERRCIRNFKPDTVPYPTISRILEAALWAPSGGNIQPWHFYVVLNEKQKKGLAEAALGQIFLAKAPVVIVVIAIPEMSGKKYGNRGSKLYCIQDTAAAIQNILLAATGFGLGSCWVGAFEEEKVKAVLESPAEYKPVAIIPIGYFDASDRVPPRRSLEDTVTVIE